jgi:hypothetical protein
MWPFSRKTKRYAPAVTVTQALEQLSATIIRVEAIHKLPFSPEGFAKDMASVADHAPKIIEELRKQYRENWENAWIVVIEADGPSEQIDFSGFAHPEPKINPQGAWEGQILESVGQKTRAAFFLHYVQIEEPLYYKGQPLAFPAPSPAPRELVEKMNYFSPD